jgi:outer membrane protein TolC
MKYCRTTTLLVALAAILLAVPESRAQQTMTIEDAIRLGLEHNFSIRIARNDAEIAGSEAGRGRANFLPTVDASGNYTLSTTDQETNSPFSFEDSDTKGWAAEVSFRWTVFDGFRMFADSRRLRELERLGEFQARNLIENTVVQISGAYFDLVQQEQLLEVFVETREISRARLDREQVRNDLGGASSTDLFNARVAYNSDEAALLNQQLSVDIARQRLNILLGRAPDSALTVSDQFAIPPLTYGADELLQRAERNNSALLLAEQNRRVAEERVRIERADFFPRLAVTGSYGYSDRTTSSTADRFSEDITTESTDGSIGLVLTYNLFNGGRDAVDLRSARLEARGRQLELERARLELNGLVREKLRTFEQRQSLVELEQQNFAAAGQNLQLQQDRFDLGVATSLEFRDAQVNFARVQTSLIVARYRARIAHLEIEQLIGAIQIDQL